MKFSTIALTTFAAVPLVDAWSCGPNSGYGVFVRPGLDIDTLVSPSSQMRRRRREQLFNQASAFTRTSPRYEISDSEEAVTISFDVPGVKAEDVNVSVEDDGKVLSISGQREKVSDRGSYMTRFSQQFALDPTVDLDRFTASLKNGVLVVTAPKDLQRIENNIRKIPVMNADSGPSMSVEKEQEAPVASPEKVDTTISSSNQETDTDTAPGSEEADSEKDITD